MEELEQARARIFELEGQIGTLTRERDAARAEREEGAARLAELQGEAETARSAAGAAQSESLGHLRRALLAENAGRVVDELVQGTTAEELAASVERAGAAMARATELARHQIEAQRVPAGTPARDGAGAENLSPTDKIARGLQERARA